MPTIRLTQVAVDRLKPPAEGRVEYWDTSLPGFGLRVAAPRSGSKGRKTWQCLYRVKGKLVRETLGTLELIPKVDDARERARASMLEAKSGGHPVEQRRRTEEEERQSTEREAARQRDTLGAILDRYLAERGAKRWRPETLKETARSFAIDFAALRGRPIRDIARRDVREVIDGIVERGRAPYAHHALAYIRPALTWAVEKEIIETNPAIGIPDPDPRRREARTRDRYLQDHELRLFWPACEALGWPFGPLFKLLLLTAQRRDELAEASWSEFDLAKALWTLPRQRSKNDKGHLVHLPSLAMEIIERLPTIGDRGYIFTTTGDTPVSGFGNARDRLAATMLDLRRAELAAAGGAEHAEQATIPHFTIHDLRRTAATGMAGIGIAHHVLDRVLNHTGGKISGVGAIYNRFEYLVERKAALEAWGRHVESLIRPTASNVVELATAR
jgi:integrase